MIRRPWFLPLSLAAVFALSGGLVQAAEPETPETSAPPMTLPDTGTGFGEYELAPRLSDEPAYAGPPTPRSLRDVRMSERVDRLLDAQAEQALARHGFVIAPADFRLFHQAYEEQAYTNTPVFVTTDAAYHTWHLIFDKALRDLETRRLDPSLKVLVAGMLTKARQQRRELAGSELAADASRVVQLLQVAGAELGIPVGKLGARATQEKALVDEHMRYVASPILGTLIDYSLFTPRGHYTRTPTLTRYFVAMSVLGQSAFLLPGSVQSDESVVGGVDGLRLAVLAARTVVGDEGLESRWREIYEPTAFLVGTGDDYTPFELSTAVETVVEGGMEAPLTVTDEVSLLRVADALKAQRTVRIDAERPSVRLMGTRFVIDSWVLDQLVYPNVGGPAIEDRRFLASPLDLAAAFGSGFALAIQRRAGETEYLHYPEQMAAMRAALSARADEAWGGTVYDAWLAAIEPMWMPHGRAFPDFMRRPAWRAKAQQTGLGSYAELKHDTILYAKQFVGEAGGGPLEPPPALRNWVEPDPVPFARLGAMATLMRDGLEARGLLTPSSADLLGDYLSMVEHLERLATDELAGKPISKADNDWLKTIGARLESFWWKTGDKVRTSQPSTDDWAAVVADIGSGNGIAVETGTGYVDRIFVLVPNDQGRFQVATGAVYSYYEFTLPIAERMTDETWRQLLESDREPDRPSWEDPLFP